MVGMGKEGGKKFLLIAGFFLVLGVLPAMLVGESPLFSMIRVGEWDPIDEGDYSETIDVVPVTERAPCDSFSVPFGITGVDQCVEVAYGQIANCKRCCADDFESDAAGKEACEAACDNKFVRLRDERCYVKCDFVLISGGDSLFDRANDALNECLACCADKVPGDHKTRTATQEIHLSVCSLACVDDYRDLIDGVGAGPKVIV